MADPIHSSAWTGPPESMAPPGRAFTHRTGEPSGTGDYARFAEHARLAGLMSPERKRTIRFAALLMLSPVTLWIGTLILDSVSHDVRVAGHGDLLMSWGMAVAMIGGWGLWSSSERLLWGKQALFGLGLLATLGLAVGNVYVGLRSNAAATASPLERVFVQSSSSGRAPFRTITYSFQRKNGTFVGGSDAEAPPDYGPSCAMVQRLDGPHGYAWVRILDRSRQPGRGELSWPIRREECFSDIPLSTLPR